MKSVFDIPNSLLESINSVIGLRRNLELHVADMHIGIVDLMLSEVYQGDFVNYLTTKQSHKTIHDSLRVNRPSKHLITYTKDSSHLNQALWDNHVNNHALTPTQLDAVSDIESNLLHRDGVNGLKLYSGLPMSPIADIYGPWSADKQLKTFHNPAFTSTSTDINTAFRFSTSDKETMHHDSDHHGIVLPNARHIIEISMPKGIHELASTAHFSQVDLSENEVLLGRGYMFNIHHRPTQIGHNPLNPVYLWHAHEAEVNPFRKKLG
jgi:ADP-ribosyltransferase exoenzyme